MKNIEFISHEDFPEDEYTKEIVYLCLEGKYRVAYVRKKASNGGLFWAVPAASATKHGKKEYFPAFMQDSNFLEKDIKTFLEGREWEGRNAFTKPSAASTPTNAGQTQAYQPRSMSEVAMQDEMPF